MRKRGLDLRELVDLEAQLHRDRSETEARLAERDQRIGKELASRFGDVAMHKMPRAQLIREWLYQLIDPDQDTPGLRFVSQLRLFELVLGLLGVVTGVGAAVAALHYDGTTPINVVQVLAVLLGVQLILLVMLALSLLWPSSTTSLRRYGPVRELVRWTLWHRLKRKSERGGAGSVAALLQNYSYYRGLYSSVERWLLLSLTQLFALFFNIAVVATYLYLVLFTDLAFGWATTVGISPDEFHQLIRILAAPWLWAGDGLAPSLDLVRDTQYFRLEGRYLEATGGGRAAGADIVAGWWPFLLMALLVYGLGPRMVTFVYSRVTLARALASLGFTNIECEDLLNRLTRRFAGWKQATEETGELQREMGSGPSILSDPFDGGIFGVVLWRDIPLADKGAKEVLARERSLQVETVLRAGGRSGDLDGSQAARAMGESVSLSAIIVMVEGWEAPGKAIKRFLQGLRTHLRSEVKILVYPVEVHDQHTVRPAGADSLRLWGSHIGSLGDPHTGLMKHGGTT